MTLLRKFYDSEVAEQATGGVTSAAEAMAKVGYKSGGEFGDTNRPPIQIKEEPKQEATKEEAATATASAETKVEKVEETPKPTEVEKAAVQETVATEPQKTISWQEVLKQQQPDTVLKELGFDDGKLGFIKELKELDPKMVAFLNTWKSGGNVEAYLKELTTDYSKMSAEDVMRNQLRQEYPKASDKQIEILFKREVVDAYSLDPEKYSEQEVEEGRLLLEAKADRYREAFTTKQQDYLLPKPPQAEAAVVDNSANEASQQFESYKAEVSNNPYTKDLFQNKVLSVGEGDDKFNFPVDPTALTDILFDSEKWAQTMFDVGLDDKGNKILTPKIQHQMLVGAVAKYGMSFLNEYAKHFKAIGGKAVIDPLENAKPQEQSSSSKSEIKPDNPAAALAKFGRLV